MKEISQEIYSESLFIARLALPGKYDLTKSGISLPRNTKSPDILTFQSEVFKETENLDSTHSRLWLPDSYLSKQSEQAEVKPEIPNIVDLQKAQSQKGRDRFKLGAFARAAAALAIAALSTASILLYGENQVSADTASSTPSLEVKPAGDPIRIVSERADFLDSTPLSPSDISLASARKAQTTRTCRELLIYGSSSISAKESDITAYFFGFPADQAQGLNFYNSSSQYFDLLNTYLETVKTFAKREVDMNLTYSVVRSPVVMDKPLFGGYTVDTPNGPVNAQTTLETAMVSKLTLPTPTKRSNKLLVALVNTDTELYQVFPYPGMSSTSEYFEGVSIALVSSILLQPNFEIAGPSTITHEAVLHGLLDNQNHNDNPNNPNPNPISVARSIGFRSISLMDLVIDDWDIQKNGVSLCQNPPDLTPTRTSTPTPPTFTPTPISVILTRRGFLPLTARRSSA